MRSSIARAKSPSRKISSTISITSARGRIRSEMACSKSAAALGASHALSRGSSASVYAFDISREMVAQARRAVAEFPNARVYRNNGKDLHRATRAMVALARHRAASCNSISPFRRWSSNTFPAAPSLRTMCARSTRCCGPAGCSSFRCQGSADVEAAPRTIPGSGASFGEGEARQMAERCGFEMRYQSGLGDQYYWLWFFKP